MPDFRFRVGADYSEFLASSRGAIQQLRSELNSLRQQSLLQVTSTGSVAGISAELGRFQGRGTAQLDEALRAGVITQSQYNAELDRLKRDIIEMRARINREAESLGLRGRVGEPSQKSVDAGYRQAQGPINRARTAKQQEDAEAAQLIAARQQQRDTEEAAAKNRRSSKTVGEIAATQELKLQEELKSIEAARENARLQAQVNVARRQQVAAVRRAELEERGVTGGGTVFQRVQSFVASRKTGEDRLPEEFQSFGQFFASKALTTAGFALSGAALYGAVQGFREIIREASALQRELAIVKSQFDTLGDSQGFADFSKQVVDISVNTGVAADQVALVARQLSGVFRSDVTGLPDFNRALSETQQALKLQQVTGLPTQEITDSLTSITTTFGVSFTKIGDLAIGLERRFGVLAPQIISFVADLAPVAKELGFTVDQIAALGAIAQQRSGVSGSALAESFNRALPAIQGSQVALAQLLGQRSETESFITGITQALSSGQGAQALELLTQAYGKMTQAQRQALGELLGGQRNAKAFFAVLQGGQDTIDALAGKTGEFGGALDARFKDFQSTVEFAFEQARRELEKFGLALFNSGIADGLKLIADSGGLVMSMATQLLQVFTDVNNALGGLPAKLLAVYAALRLLSALGGGTATIKALFAAITARGAAASVGGAAGNVGGAFAGQQFLGPVEEGATATAAAQAFKIGIPLGGVGTAIGGTAIGAGLSSIVASMGPAIAAVGIASIVSTVQGLLQEGKEAQKNLADQVHSLEEKGVSQGEILKRVHEAGGGGDVGITFGGYRLPFGLGGQDNPDESTLKQFQKENSERQGKELDVLIANSKGRDKERLEGLKRQFLADPSNKVFQVLVPRLIQAERERGSGAIISGLKDVADEYDKNTAAGQAQQAVDDYAPTLDEVKSRFESGNASLQELVNAERHNIDLIKNVLNNSTGASRAKAAQELAAAQKELDNYLVQRANRLADVSVRLAGLRGDNTVSATVDAKLSSLNLLKTQGASPDAQLDAALAALDAQQKKFEQYINSPVTVDGITRAPTTAEKLARAQEGFDISPEVREAVMKGTLVLAKAGEISQVAQASGTDQATVIDAVIKLVRDADRTGIDALKRAIDSRIANLQRELVNLEPDDSAGRKKVNDALAALQQARSALEQLPSGVQDPGAHGGQDNTDLNNQTAIDNANEAKALQEAYIAQERARAHGDPVAVAQANLHAAQLALRYARASGKPSEVAAAQAQIIEAQNELNDAQAAVVDSQLQYTESLTHDPVKKANLELERARAAVANAHGEAARLQALARELAAEQGVTDAINSVLDAQAELVEAIATAAGDAATAARARVDVDRRHLQNLIDRDRKAGDDPNADPDVLHAQAQLVADQAAVRDADLQQRERDIDFALQIGRITTAQAIAQFQALLQIPGLTAEETQQILLKIKQLQNELSRDLQFDIPSEIKLPTLYEVRRLQQVGTPGGPQTYQDQRSFQINLNASSQVDLQPAVDTIVGVITAPPRNGSTPGAY